MFSGGKKTPEQDFAYVHTTAMDENSVAQADLLGQVDGAPEQEGETAGQLHMHIPRVKLRERRIVPPPRSQVTGKEKHSPGGVP